MSILFYKRPDYVPKGEGPMTASSCQVYAQKMSGKSSIPERLSFERVMANKTMPVSVLPYAGSRCLANLRQPCSLNDFLNYLIYVAHDAENLQFYLWCQDYKKRFDALPANERALSPEWQVHDIVPDLRRPGANSVKSTPSDILDREIEAQYLANLEKMAVKHEAPPMPPSKDLDDALESPPFSPTMTLMNVDAERRWKSFTIQPFRNEISQIITHYLLPNSPRELNLSHKARANLLHALHRTTHPSAFSSIEELTLVSLRHHAHPNFIRWSLCNGNKPRVVLLRGFAVTWILLFITANILLILSSKTRWVRIAVAPVLWVGSVNLIASAKGLCVLLHRLHTREIHPWELDSNPYSNLDEDSKTFADELAQGHRISSTTSQTELVEIPKGVESSSASMDYIDLEARPKAPTNSVTLRLSPLGPRNEFKGEAWVERWRNMSPWQRVRLRKVWMKEEGLRLMQNKIIVQAELWSLMLVILVEVGIVACPVVGLF
jgi:hypothetical protein